MLRKTMGHAIGLPYIKLLSNVRKKYVYEKFHLGYDPGMPGYCCSTPLAEQYFNSFLVSSLLRSDEWRDYYLCKTCKHKYTSAHKK